VDEKVVLFAETGGLPRLKGVCVRSEGKTEEVRNDLPQPSAGAEGVRPTEVFEVVKRE
jgi:hypothetical protein